MFNQRYNSSASAEFDAEQDEQDEARAALRWRSAILRLSENLRDAADKRSELSPFLMEGLHNALENLLLHGKEDDLMLLEEWLEHENDGAGIDAAKNDARENNTGNSDLQERPAAHWLGFERRCTERRFAERRVASHFQITAAPAGDQNRIENRSGAERRAAATRRAADDSPEASELSLSQ